MEFVNIPILVLLAVLAAVVVSFVIIRGFKLPKSFYERERQRMAMRQRLMEQNAQVDELRAASTDEAQGSDRAEPKSSPSHAAG
jgi:hypothetical protein